MNSLWLVPPLASGTRNGLLSTVAQTIAGPKTFTSTPEVPGLVVAATGATVTVEQTSGGTSFLKLIDSSVTQAKFQKTVASGDGVLDFDVLPLSGTNKASVRFGRSTNTTGEVSLAGFKGDGTGTTAWRMSGNDVVDSYVAALTDQLFGIGTSSPLAKAHVAGNLSSTAWTTNGIGLRIGAASYTDTSSSGTVAHQVGHGIGRPTFAASSATEYTMASSLYLAGPPIAGANVTITTPYTLEIASGDSLFEGEVVANGGARVVGILDLTLATVEGLATPRSGTTSVDFGLGDGNESDVATVTITGETWVTSGSIIIATAQAVASGDHDPDDAAVEGLTCHVGEIVEGDGFDIQVRAPNGTWGEYVIHWLGV